jgi:hypothetical protein
MTYMVAPCSAHMRHRRCDKEWNSLGEVGLQWDVIIIDDSTAAPSLLISSLIASNGQKGNASHDEDLLCCRLEYLNRWGLSGRASLLLLALLSRAPLMAEDLSGVAGTFIPSQIPFNRQHIALVWKDS